MLFVLMYHKIVNNGESRSSYDTSIEGFRQQLEFLKKINCKIITTRDLYICLDNKNPEGQIMITFDDGYEDNFLNAFPALLEFKMQATFFIATDWIEKKEGMMNWEQIRKMSANGMAIESHTHSHRFLTGLNKNDVASELTISKKLIKEKTGLESYYFSCPGGRVNKKIISIAKSMDMKGIFTSVPGINNKSQDRQFIYYRILINKNVGIHKFKAIFNKTNTDFFVDKFFYKLKNMLKFIMGNKLYYRFWTQINKK